MSNKEYFGRDDSGALVLTDKAWVTGASPGTYEISPGDVRDNTDYARKASASNKAEMYAARQLSVLYSPGEPCPVLAIDGVRALGTARKPDTIQRYGKDFIRLAIPTSVIDTLCAKIGRKIKLTDPPIEKSTVKGDSTIFTVGIPASCTLGALVPSQDAVEEGVADIAGLSKELDTFCAGLDFDVACTFVLKAKYKGRTVPLGEIPAYTLVLEPCSITITDVHEDMMDPSGSAGLPKVELGASAPTTAVLSPKLVDFMKSLNIT